MIDDLTTPGTLREWILERVPLWFRSRWPLAGFYWQPADLVIACEGSRQLALIFGDEELVAGTIANPEHGKPGHACLIDESVIGTVAEDPER